MKSALFLSLGLAFGSVAFAQTAPSEMKTNTDESMNTAVVKPAETKEAPAAQDQAAPSSEMKTNTDESMDMKKDEMKKDEAAATPVTPLPIPPGTATEPAKDETAPASETKTNTDESMDMHKDHEQKNDVEKKTLQ